MFAIKNTSWRFASPSSLSILACYVCFFVVTPSSPSSGIQSEVRAGLEIERMRAQMMLKTFRSDTETMKNESAWREKVLHGQVKTMRSQIAKEMLSRMKAERDLKDTQIQLAHVSALLQERERERERDALVQSLTTKQKEKDREREKDREKKDSSTLVAVRAKEIALLDAEMAIIKREIDQSNALACTASSLKLLSPISLCCCAMQTRPLQIIPFHFFLHLRRFQRRFPIPRFRTLSAWRKFCPFLFPMFSIVHTRITQTTISR
jgi:hypothetical protein